jgi:hypothetical protein
MTGFFPRCAKGPDLGSLPDVEGLTGLVKFQG